MIMKEFDIESIGKKMPYAAPKPQFFEQLPNEVMQRIESSKRRTMVLRRVVSFAAAAVFMGVVATFTLTNIQHSSADSYDQMDQYLGALSDDELSTLLAESESMNEFYTNL